MRLDDIVEALVESGALANSADVRGTSRAAEWRVEAAREALEKLELTDEAHQVCEEASLLLWHLRPWEKHGERVRSAAAKLTLEIARYAIEHQPELTST